MMRVHKKTLPGSILVITNLSQEELKVASHPCGICCKNFSSSKVCILISLHDAKIFTVFDFNFMQNLSNHLTTCKGKFLYPCSYCQATFVSREQYTSHLMSVHKPDTGFAETAVFVGETGHKTRMNRDSAPVSTERSLVYLEPNVKNEAQIFNETVISNLRVLLHYDVALGKRISVRLLCRALIQKFEGDQVLTKPFYCQTKPVILK